MSLFIETIRATKGRLGDLRFHQQRVDETCHAFGGQYKLSLTEKLQQLVIPTYPISKIRVTYTIQGWQHVEIMPYQIKPINSLALVHYQNNSYNYKYADRQWLNNLKNNVETDEILLVENGYLKDASYANLALYNGNNWYTPRQPLLYGTKRNELVKEGLLLEKEIHVNELLHYEKIKLINAMMLWDESPELLISQIVY